MEKTKAKAKKYYQINKVKLQERSQDIIEIFLKKRKLKKGIMLTTEIKICQTNTEKEKIIYEKLLMLNHIIDRVEELKNVSFNASILKYCKSIKK